jgi:hypothetical protein
MDDQKWKKKKKQNRVVKMFDFKIGEPKSLILQNRWPKVQLSLKYKYIFFRVFSIFILNIF